MSRSRARGLAPLLIATAFALGGCGTSEPSPTPTPPCPSAAPTAAEAPAILADADLARVHTNKGDFTVELYGDLAPIATANFVSLARCGFYTGITFHRVAAGFVIQAGDPQTKFDRGDFPGVGTGGPGYAFTIEPPDPSLGYDPYMVAMANAGGTATNGSQFFVDLADLNDRLARSYTIFGQVVDGTGVIDAIGELPTDTNDVPLDPAVIIGVEILPTAASPSPGS
jgi:peptidylprolyl isomerase